ncbi:MAG: ATP-binding protein [Desulfobulbaceae bacterium]|nr:ATP-binding protein [Desulfobulbaceae bacterium]MDY0351070.1 ATP-binding protein [Desulfobulbaceae bacterium]
MDSAKILEILASYNRFWAGEDVDSGIEREMLGSLLSQLASREVVVLKGVRRSGKSTLLAQVIRHLVDSGTNPLSILRVNLEEPLFSAGLSVELLERIYRTYREKVYPKGRCSLFLDEIQNVPDWEKWVRGRNETENIKIYIAGSSATMLSREIGTKLTGRQVSFEVFPLSFKEFLRFHDLEIGSEIEYLNSRSLIRHLFGKYAKYGGFPEVVLAPNTEGKELLLKNYFEDILYRDIAARHEIRDVANLRNLAVYLLTNTARQTSINKLKNNFSISQDKTENYVSALLESYLLFQLQKFSYSLKSTMRAGFKAYAVDTGVRNRIAFTFSEDSGWMIENIVFLHLRQRHEEVYFLAGGTETDFVVKEGVRLTRRIQVWYDDPAVEVIPGRELACFKGDGADNKGSECILLTNDYSSVVDVNGVKVHSMPVDKFLIFDDPGQK